MNTPATKTVEAQDTRSQALAAFAGGNAPVAPAPQSVGAVETAARAMAEVKAAIIMAKEYPRDQIRSVDKILQACTRQTLAETALYSYARGGTPIKDASIRLAEVMAQYWGNMTCGVIELERRAGVSECMAFAWDLETNFRDERRFSIRHLRDTKSGPKPVTDERDIYEVVANMGARRKRACILTVIPGDVKELAVAEVEKTLATHEKVTPEHIKAMVERFAEIGVTKEMIEKRIQRRVDAITPALKVQLRTIYNALKDGVAAVGDFFERDGQAVKAEPGRAPKTLDDLAKGGEKKTRAKTGKDKPAKETSPPVSETEAAEQQPESEAAAPENEAAAEAEAEGQPEASAAQTGEILQEEAPWSKFHNSYLARLEKAANTDDIEMLLDLEGANLTAYNKHNPKGRAELRKLTGEKLKQFGEEL